MTETGEVGAGVVDGGFGELEVELAEGGVEPAGGADACGEDFLVPEAGGFGDEDDEVGVDADLAGEAQALGKFGLCQDFAFGGGGLGGAAGDEDTAVSADAHAATGGVEVDTGGACEVHEGLSGVGGGEGAAFGLEDDFEPAHSDLETGTKST